ncbi:pyridoxamine 5'-phosphate oxidase family protein [Paenibacillus humicola]|uniref:pyridoxamine 5'-phosphate oxidase family protein n=1 Tax=Paenibacillus humicola TaxID=3110540 RepID=UPI00237AF0E1|nr:pyridoxamine 5'-phosphate oxidase family protein [Paenibacillus humicola]
MEYHEGELAVQQRAGVQELAARMSGTLRETIPAVAAQFLREQNLLILGASGPDGRVWASAVEGVPGFVRAQDDRHVRVNAPSGQTCLIVPEPEIGGDIGMLALDFAARKRMRINGRIVSADDGGFTAVTGQVYANCPKYIQARRFERFSSAPDGAAPAPQRSSRLNGRQMREIARADTFFIATRHPQAGADASHRGGRPGFVRAIDECTLVFPDYPGNNMFNTLGNIEADPRAGLLFLNFENGDALQLTGEAAIEWDAPDIRHFPGADRLVRFRIGEAVQTDSAFRSRYRFEAYSPFNPAG